MPEKAINEGRAIKTLCWPDGGGETGRVMFADAEITMAYHSKCHGDHDENWVLVMKGGVETARHNTRFIESIIWAD